MSYTLGQQVVLATTVTDTLGAPTDATMSLVVTKPDGSTLVSGVGLTIAHPGVGQYSCTVPATTLAGTWLYLWTASGAAIGTDDGQFDVLAITRRIVSLASAKLHLNKNNTADDVEIQDFIDAASAVVVREVGPVVPTSYTESLPAPNGRLILTWAPVISITTVIENGATVAPSGYRLNATAGIIERVNGNAPTYWAGNGSQADITVTYLAGRTGAVPPNIRLATLELVAHLWRNSQMGRNRRVRGTGPEDDTQAVALGFSLPNRVRELLGSKRPALF